MVTTKVQVYVHLVWTTWRRRPLIRAEFEAELHRILGAKCIELRCQPRAIGGTADHVHMLVRLHPATSLGHLVAALKGGSAHAVTHRLAPAIEFRWQQGYGAFSIGPEDIDVVERYIRDQKRHHAANALLAEFEIAQEA
jgi:REP element-mobilizing transposase RayT